MSNTFIVEVRAFVLALVFLMACQVTPVWASLDIEDDTDGYMLQADGLATDLNGANQQYTLWARFRHETVVDAGGVISKENTATNQRQFALLVSSSAVVTCPVSSAGAASTTGTSTTTLLPDVEYSAACVYDDVTIQPYVDAVAEGGSAHTAGVFNGSAQFQVGQRSGVDNSFDGIIREVCVWNTALTAAQILQLHNSQIKSMCDQIAPTNLVHHCTFDDCPEGATCSTTKCTPGSDMTASGTPTGVGDSYLSYP